MMPEMAFPSSVSLAGVFLGSVWSSHLTPVITARTRTESNKMMFDIQLIVLRGAELLWLVAKSITEEIKITKKNNPL